MCARKIYFVILRRRKRVRKLIVESDRDRNVKKPRLSKDSSKTYEMSY